MALFDLIKQAVSPVTDIIHEIVPDKDLAKKLDNKIKTELIGKITQKLQAQRDVLVAEIGSNNWLAANWRPILMLSFTGIIVNNYILSPYLQAMFGFSVNLQLPPDMWDLLKIGVGGYIVGRSGEKIMRHYKAKD